MPTAEGEQKMKKTMVLVLCFIMLLPFVAAIAETSGETAGHEGKGKIVVLATGGTIAGIGEEGKTAGYIPGVLTAEELLPTPMTSQRKSGLRLPVKSMSLQPILLSKASSSPMERIPWKKRPIF